MELICHAFEPRGWRLGEKSPQRSHAWLVRQAHGRGDVCSALITLGAQTKLSGEPHLLAVTDSRMTASALQQIVAEWSGQLSADIAQLVTVVRLEDLEKVNSRFAQAVEWLRLYATVELKPVRRSSSQASVLGMVFALLLAGERSLSTAAVGRRSAASHPTVSRAVQQLSAEGAVDVLQGKFTVRHFPRRTFLHWLGEASLRRRSRFFRLDEQVSDRTLSEKVLSAIQAGALENVGVGGMHGAHLHGSAAAPAPAARLELWLPQGGDPLALANACDMDLTETDRRDPGIQLVIHMHERPDPLFYAFESGTVAADHASCLLDLYGWNGEVAVDEVSRKMLDIAKGTGTAN